MAEMYAVSGETLTGIADAIRSKTGSDEMMTVAAMASAIEGISGGGGLPPVVDKIAAGLISSDDVTGGAINIPHNFGALPDVVGVWQNIPTSDVTWGSCWCCLYKRITDDGSSGNLKKNTYTFEYLHKHVTSGNLLSGTYNSGYAVTNLNTYSAARGGSDWAKTDANGNSFNYIWFAIKFKED